jgi:RHH-type proline utilization regulon transcriptional repressor/proline dehydrogenase/delta 1-pyrroline-5-carboxylate dehydrogenase
MSLDEREIERWQSQVDAGNLYINRPITGAVVQRQAFGGVKASSFGIGIKAGGPNYIQQFCQINVTQYTDVQDLINHYQAYFNRVFNVVEDMSHIYGEHNYLRYKPAANVIYRIQKTDKVFDVVAILEAARITRCSITVSYDDLSQELKDSVSQYAVRCVQESITTLSDRLDSVERLRFSSPIKDDQLISRISLCRTTLIDHRPYHHARFELIHYLTEQSVSHRYHRYGNTSYLVPLYPSEPRP